MELAERSRDTARVREIGEHAQRRRRSIAHNRLRVCAGRRREAVPSMSDDARNAPPVIVRGDLADVGPVLGEWERMGALDVQIDTDATRTAQMVNNGPGQCLRTVRS